MFCVKPCSTLVLSESMNKENTINAFLILLGLSMNSVMPIVNRIDFLGRIHLLETRVDKKIPVKVVFVIPYLIYFPYLLFGWIYMFMFQAGLFPQFAIGMGLLGLFTGLINILFPTHAPRAYIYGGNIFSKLIRWHYGLNRPLTAFPSLHVGHSICLSFFFLIVLPQLSLLWIGLAALIAASTLFTKEHYVIDVVGGSILGLLVSVIVNLF